MKAKILFGLYLVLCLCVEVYGDGDHEARRGTFPYMAFIYYPDESVVDTTGARFLRGAVLIRPDWLVTSAVGPSVTEVPDEFPRKTLLARLGAITIDTNFTLNEDEEEQEREVTQIVRPYNYSATQWWVTDISLMKTLLPFNTTAAVGYAALSPTHTYTEKMCMIVVYAKKEGAVSDDRILMQYYVELLPPSIENCGSHFQGNTMTCGVDRDDNKISLDSGFCQGNSGGPLICEGDVMGLQTYINNDCKQPHLYQLLSSWDNFIVCGTEDRCKNDDCKNVCSIINKDSPPLEAPLVISTTEIATEVSVVTTTSTYTTNVTNTTETTTTTTTEYSTTENVINTTVTEVNTEIAEVTTASYTVSTDQTSDTTTETEPIIKYSSTRRTSTEYIPESRSWPREKNPSIIETETPERPTNVEAQHQQVQVRSGGHNIVSNFRTIPTGFFILAFLT